MTILIGSKKAYFSLTCAWCGVEIRRNTSQDSNGTCLSCFYRILNERLRSRRLARQGDGVSDR